MVILSLSLLLRYGLEKASSHGLISLAHLLEQYSQTTPPLLSIYLSATSECV